MTPELEIEIWQLIDSCNQESTTLERLNFIRELIDHLEYCYKCEKEILAEEDVCQCNPGCNCHE
jgi:hypothetical protein